MERNLTEDEILGDPELLMEAAIVLCKKQAETESVRANSCSLFAARYPNEKGVLEMQQEAKSHHRAAKAFRHAAKAMEAME